MQSFSPAARVNGIGGRQKPLTIPVFKSPMCRNCWITAAKVVVLSRGMAECLHVSRETLDFLKERQIAVHVLPTQHAVALYNKLAQTEAVGGLFHTTC